MSITNEPEPISNSPLSVIIEEDSWILALAATKLLVKKKGNKFYIPKYKDLKGILTEPGLKYITMYEGHTCYGERLKESFVPGENFELIEIREITYLTGNPEWFMIAGTANHILHWYSMNQFCGRCGHKTYEKDDERAKVCPDCGNIIYPRISPATITLVKKDDKILLAHNKNFKSGLYSLIAGFVEPGETLEHCVEREIQEEVGIKVKNITYFTSQPWPFPESLMLAFTAEYDSGDITVDQTEITDAAWFNADSLPDIPSTDSVAGKLIRWYRDNH
ncbi:NAD(+) diphosphatase [Anaerocolumna sp. AGMB13025]|uniref:NAD(+) diphosphatase n=1 Tax=Anaerocolumna sp. AGMB13025 TaxID=3039116 RepID=UPI00241DB16F|nr:NAD(+) diphosphatase [Anaerocolumna sp. AGMB13025]WFR55659.1 NAD(+) diphosphatase [Anaerocolumna sp. AGMB13025]